MSEHHTPSNNDTSLRFVNVPRTHQRRLVHADNNILIKLITSHKLYPYEQFFTTPRPRQFETPWKAEPMSTIHTPAPFPLRHHLLLHSTPTISHSRRSNRSFQSTSPTSTLIHCVQPQPYQNPLPTSFPNTHLTVTFTGYLYNPTSSSIYSNNRQHSQPPFLSKRFNAITIVTTLHHGPILHTTWPITLPSLKHFPYTLSNNCKTSSANTLVGTPGAKHVHKHLTAYRTCLQTQPNPRPIDSH